MCHWTVRRDTGIQRSRLYIIQIPWTLNWTQQLDNNLDLTLWGSWWLHALCLSWILGSKEEDCARNSCLPISILSFFLTEIDCSSLRQDFCLKGFPGGSDGKESTCNVGDPGLIPGSRKIPWRRAWQPTSVFLPGESHGQGSLVGYSPWDGKELDTFLWLSVCVHVRAHTHTHTHCLKTSKEKNTSGSHGGLPGKLTKGG